MLEEWKVKKHYNWAKTDGIKHYDKLKIIWTQDKTIKKLIKKMFDAKSKDELNEICAQIESIIEGNKIYLKDIGKYDELKKIISISRHWALEMINEIEALSKKKKSYNHGKYVIQINHQQKTSNAHVVSRGYGYSVSNKPLHIDVSPKKQREVTLNNTLRVGMDELLSKFGKSDELSKMELEDFYDSILDYILKLERSINLEPQIAYDLYELLNKYEKKYSYVKEMNKEVVRQIEKEYAPQKLYDLVEDRLTSEKYFYYDPKISEIYFREKPIQTIINWIIKHDFSHNPKFQEEVLKNATYAIYEDAVRQGLVEANDNEKFSHLYTICSELLESPEIASYFGSSEKSDIVEKIQVHLEKTELSECYKQDDCVRPEVTMISDKQFEDDISIRQLEIGIINDSSSNEGEIKVESDGKTDALKNRIQEYINILGLHITIQNPNFSEYERAIINELPKELSPNECAFYQEKSMSKFVKLKINLLNDDPTIQDIYSVFYDIQKIFVDYLSNGYDSILEEKIGKRINFYSLLYEFEQIKNLYLNKFNNMTDSEQQSELNKLSYIDGDSPINIIEKLSSKNLMNNIYNIVLTNFKNDYINDNIKDLELSENKLRHVCTGMLISDIVDLYNDIYSKLSIQKDRKKIYNLQKMFINVIKQQIIERDICNISYNDDVSEEICNDFLNQKFMGNTIGKKYNLLENVLLFEFKIKKKIFANQSSYGELYGQAVRRSQTVGECYGIKN